MNESPPNELGLIRQSTGAVMVESTKSAAISEVIGMISVAKKMRRDEAESVALITRACSRKGLAQDSQYAYSRGGTQINGPSIVLLRVICNAWGNMDYGWQELERRDGESHVRAYAWDMQSNTRAHRTFVVKHRRDTRDGGYDVTDERDIYELIANAASRRVRACLEELIPADIIAAAVQLCDKTMEKDTGEPLADQIRSSLAAFSAIGISRAQIETRYQKKAEALTRYDIADLRKVYVALKEGSAKPADHFRENMEVAIERASTQPSAAVESAKQAVRHSTKRKQPELRRAPEPDDDVPFDTPEPTAQTPATGETELQTAPPSSTSPQDEVEKRVASLGADFASFMITMKRLKWHEVLKSLAEATSFQEISTENANRTLRFWTDTLAKEIERDAPPPADTQD